jgi:hypothetical protein
MKTKVKTPKAFDTIKTFRKIKEKISSEIQGMTYEEFKKYLTKKSTRKP